MRIAMHVLGFCFIVLSIVMLDGCAQRPQAIMPISSFRPSETQLEKNYRIGEKQTAFIGAPMIRVREYATSLSDIAIPNESFVMSPFGIPIGGFSAVGGQQYKITAMIVHDGETLFVVPIATTGMTIGRGAALVRRDGTIFDHPLVSGDVVAPDRYSINPPDARFSINSRKDFSGIGGESNYELIFSGLSSDSIRLVYREYTGENVARSAFNQELTYEKSSKQIRFRNLLMQIERITNEEIDFTVINE